MRAVLPEGALLCRFGGEEFAVAVPTGGLPAARACADAIAAQLAAGAPHLTVSVGIAVRERGRGGCGIARGPGPIPRSMPPRPPDATVPPGARSTCPLERRSSHRRLVASSTSRRCPPPHKLRPMPLESPAAPISPRSSASAWLATSRATWSRQARLPTSCAWRPICRWCAGRGRAPEGHLPLVHPGRRTRGRRDAAREGSVDALAAAQLHAVPSFLATFPISHDEILLPEVPYRRRAESADRA